MADDSLSLAEISLQDFQATSSEKVGTTDPFVEIREAAEAQDAEAESVMFVVSSLCETIAECRTVAESRGSAPEPSANEYLAAVLLALQRADYSHLPPMVAVLAAVMPHANRSLLRLKFPAISSTLGRLLTESVSSTEEADDALASSPAKLLSQLLRCMGQLLAAQEASSAVWSNPAVLRSFHSLLRFFADRRSKVRRAAHEAVVHILEAQRISRCSSTKGAMAQAMDFCRAVVTSCTSQDVDRALSLLHFMRSAVPLFPPKQASSLCELSLRLLSLGSPTLTAAVMQMLSAVVQSPRSSLTAPLLEMLIEKLLRLQPSGSAGAGPVSFAPLVATCVVRLQGMDADASGKLLPRATNALVGYCESSSTAVHTASCGAINLMFQACVDQGMVTKMANSLGRGQAPSGPLAETLTALESLLQYRFQRSWPKSLPLLGRLFLHLRGASYPLLIGMLRGLGELHDAVTSVPTAALPVVISALDEAVGFAIEGMGAESVLGALPLAIPGPTQATEGPLAESRAWLLPLLTEHTRAAPSSLAFFQKNVLATAKACDVAVKSGHLSANATRTQRFRVEQLWGLLPGFCTRPTDIASAFGVLAPVLANAMQDVNYPGILTHVCAGLQALVAGAKARCSAEVGGGDEGVKADVETLSRAATRFLPKLFNLVVPVDDNMATASGGVSGGTEATAAGSVANEKTVAVCGAAAAMASIAPAAFLASLFKKLLRKLIQTTTGEGVVGSAGEGKGDDKKDGGELAKAQVLLELAAGLVPSLNDEAISLLYRTAKPLVRDDATPQLQKRAYKVMLALCTHRQGFMSSPENLSDVLELFASSLLTCHVSARVMRLQCLSRLSEGGGQDSLATSGQHGDAREKFFPSVTLEVVLCMKDSNSRTRELAHSVLVSLALARGSPADTVKTVVGAVAAGTPHARSAAVIALAHLQLEFGHFRSERWDAGVASMTPELIRTMLLLLKEPSREVVKAVLGWLRIGIGGADREVLRPMIGDIVQGVMSGATPRHKDHFRAKIRVVLSKLCRKFGFEEIKGLMPEQDKKLVSHMQTTAERELKAKKARLNPGGDGGGEDNAKAVRRGRADSSRDGERGITKALRAFDSMMEDSEAEDGWDSEEDIISSNANRITRVSSVSSGVGGAGGRRGRTSDADVMVRERGEDGTSVVDLLDPAMVRNMRVAKEHGHRKGSDGRGIFSDSDDEDDSDSEEAPELAMRNGKLVIPGLSDDDGCVQSDEERVTRKKKRSREEDDEDDSDGDGSVVDTGKNDGGFVHLAGRRARVRAEREGNPAGPKVQGGGAGRGELGRKRQKVAAVRGTATGEEFRSKKAGGDVRRKGATLEPYAYIPLDGRTLNSKKGGKTALKQYSAVVGTVRGAKRGYQKRRGGQLKK